MAAITAPRRTAARHQSLLHFVGQGRWSDAAVLAKVREIDDTSFPKKGWHSVGVADQYCGQLGKQANCQVAVSLSIANHAASLPVAYRLYLPKDWAEDEGRRSPPTACQYYTGDRGTDPTVFAQAVEGVPLLFHFCSSICDPLS
jgi:SRSO17 transposase